MARKLKKHKLAKVSLIVLAILYFGALFADFIAPYNINANFPATYKDSHPTKIHFYYEGEYVGPYVYGIEWTVDKATFSRTIVEKTDEYFPVRFFVKGDEYKLFGLIPSKLHLFGTVTGSKGTPASEGRV